MSSRNSRITLDLAFGMDTTGSMDPYITATKNGIKTVAKELQKAGVTDIRFGLVEYKDHNPTTFGAQLFNYFIPILNSEFVTREHNFTSNVSNVESWLNSATATGGGDRPEAVADALSELSKLTWRSHATKVVVFITDAPPHGLNGEAGCPHGLDPLQEARKLALHDITMYMVGCEPAILDCKDFMSSLAFATGGQYVPLKDVESLVQIILGSALEEVSLTAQQPRVDEMMEGHIRSHGTSTDTTSIAATIHRALAADNVQSTRLRIGESDLDGPSETAIRFAGMQTISEVSSARPGEGAAGTSASSGTAPSGGRFNVSEGTITKKQVHRMVMKSKAKKN